MTLDVILHLIPNSFNLVKIRRVGRPENRLNEPLAHIFHCNCGYVGSSIILHYGNPRSHRDHAIDKRDCLLAIFLGVDGTPFLLPKQTRAFFWPCEATPEHPFDPVLRFFSNTISVAFLESTSCHPFSRMSSILYPSFVCP
ncbi:Bgt-51888 [Blumeria graminis f. sp. tritici]|uniref:Bgt-51885 n=1 Tax=Blumeria graminis f. sp. tritici TaxID=62690 RepID=A0A9X9LB60_BLUGR|nr:Bgt-51885 [Blumeria graminis f. sp. tritici]VCU41108.1 Bgt-51888 [Blumeria graminis f. sp. tritici]